GDGECASHHCSGGQCKACQSQCAGADVCVNGTCFAVAAKGAPCEGDAGCMGGACVDGCCCASACGGLCMACNAGYTGKGNGDCMPIVAGLDPNGECNGVGAAAACSGAMPDANGDSSCGM